MLFLTPEPGAEVREESSEVQRGSRLSGRGLEPGVTSASPGHQQGWDGRSSFRSCGCLGYAEMCLPPCCSRPRPIPSQVHRHSDYLHPGPSRPASEVSTLGAHCPSPPSPIPTLVPATPWSHLHLGSISPPASSIPTWSHPHLVPSPPWSHPHPGPIPTWEPPSSETHPHVSLISM